MDNVEHTKIIHQTDTNIKLIYKGIEYTKEYKKGDDAIYIPLDNDRGLKIIYPNPKYGSQEQTYNNLLKFQNKKYSFFPSIGSIHLGYFKTDDNVVLKNTRGQEINYKDDLIFLELEHINDNPNPINTNIEWLPLGDREFVKNNLSTDVDILTELNYGMLRAGLCPEDEWYKKEKNLINNKIIDFHRFTYLPQRYNMPTKANVNTLESVYTSALDRYDSMGINKWKGRIYEGFRFDNGEEFLGYTSDDEEYDSYRKLNFMYMNKCKGGKVLDIGCNEGFLSFQAALHGAESVYGFDITEQDIALAKDINKNILKLDNVKFGIENGVDYINNIKESYNVVILSSVLHQIYTNMRGAEKFLHNIAQNTKYMVYETPVNHPLMNIPLENINYNLSLFFKHVRLTYIYNAYSSGYRAIFVCWHD